MCSKIPWPTFLLTLFIALGSYYLVIGILYYRNDLRAWLARRRSGRTDPDGEKDGIASGNDRASDLFQEADRAGDPIA